MVSQRREPENLDAQSLLLAPQTSQPTLETFQDLLHRHPDAFYLARTAKALQAHWQLMKQYYLLEDQTGNWAQGLAGGGVHVKGCGHSCPQVPCTKASSGPQCLVHLSLQQKPLPSREREGGWSGFQRHGKGSQNCLEA